MPKLTPRQHEIISYIKEHIHTRSYSPSYREIQNHFGYNSVGTVYNLVQALKKKGILSTGDRRHHGLEIVLPVKPEHHEPSVSHEVELKLVGTLTAGEPINFYPHPQAISVPKAMVPAPERTYVLRAKGDLLKNEVISEGDFLVVEGRQDPQDGETIIVFLEGNRAWVKRFSLQEEGILLSSHLKNAPSTVVAPDQLDIIGVVLGLLRLY